MARLADLRIAIIGSGPAGLAAGAFLARAGHSVTLFERFPEAKPVGAGLMLQETGLAVLAALGAAPNILKLGHRIDRLTGRDARTGHIVLDVQLRGKAPTSRHALAVTRTALFSVLREAALRAGVAERHGMDVRDMSVDQDGVRVVTADDSHGVFDLIVDASGWTSRLLTHAAAPVKTRALNWGALWTTVPLEPSDPFTPHVLNQRYRRADMMAGVLPIGRPAEGEPERAALFWNLRTGDAPKWREQQKLEDWQDWFGGFWPDARPLVERVAEKSDLTVAQYVHRTLPVPYGRKIVFIGDAFHATSPQLGQGANMGLLDAAALAHAMRTSVDIESACAAYAALRRSHVRLYQAMSAVFTPMYQSSSRVLPFLRDRGGPLMSLPMMNALAARAIAGRILDPLPALGLAESVPEGA